MSIPIDEKSAYKQTLQDFGLTTNSVNASSINLPSQKGGSKPEAVANITDSFIKKTTKKSKRISKAREIWAADSETDPFKAGRIPRPFVWGAFNGTTYMQFATTAEFVEFISARDCIVYAHNGGKFDWHFLLAHLVPYAPLMVISGRLAKFRIGKAEFRDSFSIMPMPLRAYKKDDIDYALMEPDVRHLHMDVISEYLRGDCVYLFELLTAFIDEFGLHLTLAGASMKAWERLTECKAPVTTREFYQELEPYYYGGRVQCFEFGIIEHEFKIVDINSAYPHAMMHFHPAGDTIESQSYLPETDDEISRTFITLIAEGRGAFPQRKDDGSLGFPDDKLINTFHVTGWEYLAARDTGCLSDHTIVEVKTFAEKIEYSIYLNHFYEMKNRAKRTGDKARYEFAKRFLNSLYGKHGANPENYEEFTIVPPRYIEAAEIEDGYGFVCELGPHALVSKPLAEERQRYYNVAIAASITGFVRAMLWKAIKQSTGVLYCDTDCIWCVDSGTLDLDPERLGAWDTEAVCDYGAISGKKLYAARTNKVNDNGDRVWKTASKGVRLTKEQLCDIAHGKIVTHNPENPTFSLKRGVRFTSRTIKMNAHNQQPSPKDDQNGHSSEEDSYPDYVDE